MGSSWAKHIKASFVCLILGFFNKSWQDSGPWSHVVERFMKEAAGAESVSPLTETEWQHRSGLSGPANIFENVVFLFSPGEESC